MAPKPSLGLKLAQLKTAAFKCGIASTGTKPLLAQRLIDEGKPLIGNGSTRILSIDMGIRNLAYCVLDVPARSAKKKPKPGVVAWKRLNVSTTASPTVPDQVQTKIEEETEVPEAKESFTPAALSTAAYDLLRNKLIPLNPAYILIERQRFRSMSSPHVLEWTIRINMFESILYGVLCTLKAEGLWGGEVIAITPMRVGPYWFPKEETLLVSVDDTQKAKLKKVRTTANAKALNKGRKIDLVRNWLEHDETVDLMTEEAKATAKSYVEKWDGRSTKKKSLANGEEYLAKLDDLADSLLQGMAWIQWDENKRILAKHGALALSD